LPLGDVEASDPDTLGASAKAYLGALNEIVMNTSATEQHRRRVEGDSRHSPVRNCAPEGARSANYDVQLHIRESIGPQTTL